MFRSQESIQLLLQKPNANLTSRLANVVIVLLMINMAFYFAIDPFFESQFGNYKWIFVLLLPPVQFIVQRFLFVLTSRLGLLMFASDRLPVDKIERQSKWNLLKKYYPYTFYPTAVLSVLAAPLSASFFLIFLVFLGLIYMYLLRVQLLKEVFGVSGAVAFWGPLLVELLISFVITMIVFLLTFIAISVFNIPLAP